jgi:hypothetical protein
MRREAAAGGQHLALPGEPLLMQGNLDPVVTGAGDDSRTLSQRPARSPIPPSCCSMGTTRRGGSPHGRALAVLARTGHIAAIKS